MTFALEASAVVAVLVIVGLVERLQAARAMEAHLRRKVEDLRGELDDAKDALARCRDSHVRPHS